MSAGAAAGDRGTPARASALIGRRAARHPLIWLAAIAAVALVLRVVQLEREALWADESLTVLIRHWPVGDLLLRPVETSPGLYYILMKWLVPDGAGLAAVRALPVLFGVASVVVTYFVGRMLFTSAFGLVASAMLAVSPVIVDYSQEARPYSLLILLILLSAAGILHWTRELRAGRRAYSSLALFALATLLAFYTHFTSIFWIVPAVMVGREITDRFKNRRASRAYFFVQIVLVLLAIPELMRAFGRTKFGSFGFLHNVDGARFLAEWGDVVVPSGLWNGRAGAGSPISAVVLSLALIWVAARLWSARAEISAWARENPARPLVIASLTAVPLLVWIFGYLVTPIFMPRSILLGAVGFILLLVLSDRFHRWPIGSAAFIALSAATLALNGTVREKEQWRPVAGILKASMRPGDAIVMCPDWRIGSLLHALGPVGNHSIFVARDEMVIPLRLPKNSAGWENAEVIHHLVQTILQQRPPEMNVRHADISPRFWLIESECPASDRLALGSWFAPGEPRTVAAFATAPLHAGIRLSLVESGARKRPVALPAPHPSVTS